MRKAILLSFALLIGVSVMAQLPKTEPPVKPPAATYSIKGLTEQEYQTIFQVFASAKETVIYAPNINADAKVNTQAVINNLTSIIQAKGSKDVPDTTKKAPVAVVPVKKGGKKNGGSN